MHFTQQLVAASALATLASAFPLVEKRSNKTTFSVDQVVSKQPNRKLAGPIALSRAIGKYGKVGAKVPQTVAVAAKKVCSGNDETTMLSQTG